MRLIDADKLKVMLEPYRFAIAGFEGILALIDNVPEVDAVPDEHIKDAFETGYKMAEIKLGRRPQGDLISRGALKEEIDHLFKNGGFDSGLVFQCIDNAPSASFVISPDYVTELQNRNKELIRQLEEAERPQGEWEKEDNDDYYIVGYTCSVCGSYRLDAREGNFKFCPDCGAKMNMGGGAE